MKVIFLDFDGVLNSASYCRLHQEPGVAIDPARMALLREIVDATDAEIVLSTSWREHWDTDPGQCDETGREIDRIFAQYGIRIYGKIPDVEKSRGVNIAAWLSAHREVTDFVVLDDKPMDEGVLKGHCVLVSGLRCGLDERDVEQAVGILNGGQKLEGRSGF